MRYADPNLRDLLAGEYVLGTMPDRTRVRFERLMRTDGDLRRKVGEWGERLGSIDRAMLPNEPPARVWRAIEARLGLRSLAPTAPRGSSLASLSFWRGLALGAALVASVLVLVVTLRPPVAPPEIVAVLSDAAGTPAWIATRGAHPGEIVLAAATDGPASAGLDPRHILELWRIRDGKPIPVGLLASPSEHFEVDGRLSGELLAVSLEPAGGSPSGLPTGPVLYKGAVLPKEI